MYSIASTTSQLLLSFDQTGIILGVSLTAILASLAALMGLGFGVTKLMHYITGTQAWNDKSLRVGGFYLRKTPYKGYKRFHSQHWNMIHETDGGDIENIVIRDGW